MTLARRRDASARYMPKRTELLLVAEAPPCDLDRYFYFEDVDRHDWLFRYVYEGLTGEKPERAAKASHLARLRDAGVFMIDLHEENVEQPSLATLRERVPDLIRRCAEIRPQAIVLIKSVVHDAAHDALVEAGLPVIDERIPFPASGQQRKFLESFRRAVEAAGFRMR